jgi:O-acetyl-ADP-ribose deacetylase (regulator of RNase III)
VNQFFPLAALAVLVTVVSGFSGCDTNQEKMTDNGPLKETNTVQQDRAYKIGQQSPGRIKVFEGSRESQHDDRLKIHLIEHGNVVQAKNVDAIVNAANETLIGSAGIAAAIQRSAGPALIEEIKTIAPHADTGNRCEVGEVVVTPAFDLRKTMGNAYIFHTVGPRGSDPDKENLLKRCYENLLKECDKRGVKSIALVGLSTGIFGFPKDEAARIATDAIVAYNNDRLYKGGGTLTDIFVLTDDFDVYEGLAEKRSLNNQTVKAVK